MKELYLRCPKCNLSELVPRENGKEWKCPYCSANNIKSVPILCSNCARQYDCESYMDGTTLFVKNNGCPNCCQEKNKEKEIPNIHYERDWKKFSNEELWAIWDCYMRYEDGYYSVLKQWPGKIIRLTPMEIIRLVTELLVRLEIKQHGEREEPYNER